MESSDLVTQAMAIFKDQYHFCVPLWVKNITKAEAKGLRLAAQIVKNQGLKKFRPSKTINPSVSSRTLLNHQSQYTEAFSENVTQRYLESEVFKFVSLSSMPISKTLRSEVLMFIERWLQLKDEDIYQNYVLGFIKGFFTVVKVNDSAMISTARESFSRKKIERIPVFGRKKWVDEEFRVKLPEIKAVKSLEFLKMRTCIKDVKEVACRDHVDIIKWVSGQNPFKTVYQDQFHPKGIQTIPYRKKDFYTSTSVKLLPDFSQDN